MAESERARERGLDVKKVKFNVIIQHKDPITIRSLMNKKEALEKLDSLAAKKQKSIISKLEQFGTSPKFKILPLANSVIAELTYEQIVQISNLEDVKSITPSTDEKVTC